MNLIEIYAMKSGRLKWRLITPKKKVLAMSSGSFDQLEEVYAAINNAKGAFTHFHIIDRTP